MDFSAELDTVLKDHLKTSKVFRGTSKTIQSELLQIMLEVCHERISDEIKQANLLAVIADETSDVFNLYKVAVIYRYIVKNIPVERCWTFLNPSRHDAGALASCILDELKCHKIN